jgi:hypothetical protein
MTMSALQQILAGKKPQPASPSSSPAVATPAAQPAASASPPPTPAPAPAAAPSAPSPSPAAASAAVAPAVQSPAAAPTAVAPGPNAAAVATPQGGPQDTLAAVLGAFVANAGKMPQVNPPEAPKVLAGPTALEVAGHPEPEKEVEQAPAPVEKPADVLAAEQAKKARRTAAVVQVELDAALKELAEARAALAARPVDACVGTVTVYEADSQQVQAALAEAVELIQSLQGEAKISAEDNAKAWARVAAVEAERDDALKALAGRLTPIIAAPRLEASVDWDTVTRDELEGALLLRMPRGVSVTLTGQR